MRTYSPLCATLGRASPKENDMALIKCKECGNQVSNKAVKCPQCGAKVPVKVSIIKLVGAAFFGLILLVFYLADKPGSSITSAAGRDASAKSALEARDVHLSTGKFGNNLVAGSVVNTTSKKLTYVQVELNLFDKAGTQVGSTLANTANLEPGITWSFEAPVLQGAPTTVKVGGLTAY